MGLLPQSSARDFSPHPVYPPSVDSDFNDGSFGVTLDYLHFPSPPTSPAPFK